jgi:hypothetical protein
MQKKVFFLVLMAFMVAGCKKYPEGGYLFGLSKTEKKILGSYTIQELKANGVDTSLAGNANYCSGPQVAFLDNDVNNTKFLSSNCGSFTNKRQLVITFSNTASGGELYPIAINKDVTVAWNIQRLTKNDLWLKTNLNKIEYFLKLQYHR